MQMRACVSATRQPVATAPGSVFVNRRFRNSAWLFKTELLTNRCSIFHLRIEISYSYVTGMLTRSALIYLSRREGLKDFAARFKLFKILATRFVAGETIDEAIAFIRELNADGCSASFDHLNESVANPAEAAEEVAEYRQILSRINETGINSNVSIKLTQFGLELDPELAYKNARAVVVDAA